MSACDSVSYADSGLRHDELIQPARNMVEIDDTSQDVDQMHRGQALRDGEPDNLLVPLALPPVERPVVHAYSGEPERGIRLMKARHRM